MKAFLRRGRGRGLLGGRVQARLDRRVELVHLGSHSLWFGHVLELPLAIHRRSARPAALLALCALREVLELVGHLAHLPLLGEVRRHRGVLQPVGLQLLYGCEPLVLVHGVAGQKEREHVPYHGVPGELVEAGHLQPTLALGGDVEAHVGKEVTACDGVGGVPRVAQGVPGAAPPPVTMACWGFIAALIMASCVSPPPRTAPTTPPSPSSAAFSASTGEVSKSLATMVASISTWPISSVAVSSSMSRYLAGPRQFHPWKR